MAELTRYTTLPSGIRVGVAETELDPRWIVRRLLAEPRIASAWATAGQVPGALRRRALDWPIRLTVAGLPGGKFALVADRASGGDASVRELYDLRRWEDDRRATDVLLVRSSLRDALPWATDEVPVANIVLVLDRPEDRWPVVSASLALLRALTSAAISGTAQTKNLDTTIVRLVRDLSHAESLDAVLTGALDRNAFLVVEEDALRVARLPEIAAASGREMRAYAAETQVRAFETHGERLTSASEGSYFHEYDGARAMAVEAEAVEATVTSVRPEERFLQAHVDSGAGALPDTLTAGATSEVTAWIGPPVAEAIVAEAAFDESRLDWSTAKAYQLSVVFVPLQPRGEPQRDEIVLRRVGRSEEARFVLDAPADATEVVARLIVLHRNRVLQTAVLHGVVGERAMLDEHFVLRSRIASLDDRKAFDLALVANHDAAGIPTLLASTESQVRFVAVPPGLTAQVEKLAALLDDAINLKTVTGGLPRGKKAQRLVWDLAQAGKEFLELLEDSGDLGSVAERKRITVLTAQDNWFLPVELAYSRACPVGDKIKLCPTYIATAGQGPCDGDSCPASDDGSVVCPLGFWGLSKTIERFHVTPAEQADVPGAAVLLGDADPTRAPIRVRRSAFAADNRVTPEEQQHVREALGVVQQVASWQEWVAALGLETDLLVLLPHTDYQDRVQPALYIADRSRLGRGEIETQYVTGGHQLNPVVVLFGCETSGTATDPAGFATRFMRKGGAVVFTSLTRLLGTHAAEMAERLAHQLQPDRPPVPLGQHLMEFRRAAVWDSLIAAMAVTAYGDAEWSL